MTKKALAAIYLTDPSLRRIPTQLYHVDDIPKERNKRVYKARLGIQRLAEVRALLKQTKKRKKF